MSKSDNPIINEAIACGSKYAQGLASDVVQDSLTREQISRRIDRELVAFRQWLQTHGCDEDQQAAALQVFSHRVSSEILVLLYLIETTEGHA
ncbi:hypothetical protein [Agrobacterium tumefaciens]|uniref:Uncharacterized protein n=1 Tax=Agrobacterium tumefaciens TaxID=358 RepID=A0A176X903_AGRTU|nr:hypothetical protein [Agrobacterium tumefaciens]OAE43585.1 hypothetical protein A7J57_04785 [Agrobacterium tumefaciens]